MTTTNTLTAYRALVQLHGVPLDGKAGDFAGRLTFIVAAVTAKVGGIDALLAGRPGSWESDAVRRWMESAGVNVPDAGWADTARFLDDQLAQSGEDDQQ
jgi:hypothetical protein